MTQSYKILVAVDGSEGSMDAVRYASQFQDPQRTRITLLHIMAEMPEAVENFKQMSKIDETPIDTGSWRNRMEKRLRAFMDDAAQAIVDAGFDRQAVDIAIHNRVRGYAKDVIDAAETGYDAVFVGRRGLSDPTDVMVGSTAYRIMSGIDHIPVVIVGEKPDPNHVLIGFDGSTDAFKAVDCVSSMMYRPNRKVFLCNVFQSMQSSYGDPGPIDAEQEKQWVEKGLQQVEGLMKSAEKFLTDAGFKPDQILREVIEGRISRAVTISRTAEDNDCGTIVVGRRGLSVIKEFMMGRVSMKILHKAHMMAVWIV